VLAALPAQAGNSLIYITNSAGDAINVIDPETNKVVQTIKGEEAAHGINFSPDGTRVYVSNESTSTLDVFDQKTGNLIKKVPLTNHPNNITVSKDGRVFVGIARDPGTSPSTRRSPASSSPTCIPASTWTRAGSTRPRTASASTPRTTRCG
jgi:YVTN family beta-propeller protein